MNKLDDLYADMMRHDNAPAPPPHVANLTPGLPSGRTQYQQELDFRAEVRQRMKEMNEKLDLILHELGWIDG